MPTRRPAGDGRSAAPALARVPALPLAHPATLTVALIAAVCVVISVSGWIYDTDFWQHLLVGRVIWETHAVPTRQLWTWPTYGTPDVNASWGFRALIWPLWSAWGVWGLFFWRWASTLVAFAILWAAARRMGAKGLTPLVVLAACALVYRQRSQVRPETLVSVLIALQIWILEARRSVRNLAPAPDAPGRARGLGVPADLGVGRARDPAVWLVPIAWAWANAHISWYLGFVVLGAFLLDDLRAAGRARGATAAAVTAGSRRLLAIAVACLAVSFVNPWGWRALWQPFEFFLTMRHEPIYQGIGELQRLDWRNNDRNGLAVMLVLWPLLAAWRWRRAGLDVVEVLCLLSFTTLMLAAQRFSGFWSVVAAPFIARDLDAWIAARRWGGWTRPAWTRATLAGMACVAICTPDWLRVEYPLGVRMDMVRYPIRACDFMEAHGVRGRGLNNFEQGGYQAWRFWPDRARLPFIDVHQTGTTLDRRLYVDAFGSARGWYALDARHHFDYALISRFHLGWGRLLETLDADSTFALVFADDAAALYVRRNGPLDRVATRYAYRWLPGGRERLGPLGVAALADTALRRGLEAELLRQTRESPYNAQAFSLLARAALVERRLPDARRYTQAALRADPLAPGEHERLGMIALAEGRPREALAEFRSERRLVTTGAWLDLRFGQAYAALGDTRRARGYLQKALKGDPSNAEARAALEGLAAGAR